MGSPLGPTLADILMTAFEDEIVRPLISSDIIKFYSRYVDDTLVLIRPSDIPTVLQKFNSFHPQIQFTHEEFIDNNDIQTSLTSKSLPWARQFIASQHTLVNTSISPASLHGAEKQHGLEHLSIVHIRYAVTACYSKLNCRALPNLRPGMVTPAA